MAIASSSCDQAVSTSRQLDDGATLLAPFKPFYSRSLSFCLIRLSRLHLARRLVLFLRRIVQNTGPEEYVGDLHTIEESDGQFSEGSRVVGTRDSCHDVLTKEGLDSIREPRINARTHARQSARLNARKFYLYRTAFE